MGENEQQQGPQIIPKPVVMNIAFTPVVTPQPDVPNFVVQTVTTHMGEFYFWIDVESAEGIFMEGLKDAIDEARSGIIIPNSGIETP